MSGGGTRGGDAGRGWVVAALGSNLGDSREVLRKAMNRLQVFSVEPLLRSSIWRTAPVDCPPGSADFLNAVVAWDRQPGQTPERLLETFLSLEHEFGRPPKVVHNEPRTLDLDLIACGAETRNQERLTLPHPRTIQRAFVLYPMAEILPDLVLPGQVRTVRELRDALGEEGRLMVSRVESRGVER